MATLSPRRRANTFLSRKRLSFRHPHPQREAKFQPVAIELKKGEAAFHHPLMVHGSYENQTDRQRRATVINVFRDGVMSNTNTPLLRGVPVIFRFPLAG